MHFWHLEKQMKVMDKMWQVCAILRSFCMNHCLSIEYDNSDQEMPLELAETDSIDIRVLVRQEIIANYFN